jgi:hypothetical protein
VSGDPASTGVSRIRGVDVATLTDFLGSHAPFDVLESDELARIVTYAVVERYESGTVILDAFDSQVDELFIVREGRVDIWSHRDRLSELPDIWPTSRATSAASNAPHPDEPRDEDVLQPDDPFSTGLTVADSWSSVSD